MLAKVASPHYNYHCTKYKYTIALPRVVKDVVIEEPIDEEEGGLHLIKDAPVKETSESNTPVKCLKSSPLLIYQKAIASLYLLVQQMKK